jgi:hypothetical protein
MGYGNRNPRTLQVEMDHQFTTGRNPAMGAVDIHRVVVLVKKVLENDLRLSHNKPSCIDIPDIRNVSPFFSMLAPSRQDTIRKHLLREFRA